MNKSFNKRKNNNNKFDKSPENFKINMNNINNLGNINMQRITRRAKTRRNQKYRTRKSRSEIRSKNQRRETIRITKGRTKR